MSIYSLFNIAVPHAARAPGRQGVGPRISAETSLSSVIGSDDPDPESGTTAVGAFVTPQTLVTFTGATGVIASVYACIHTLIAIPDQVGKYVLLLLSVVVGVVIYWINQTDPRAPVLDSKSRAIAIVIAG